MIFAAKTTASGLIALLVAFTFNLDQPQWALLTVFIVSQPQQSGLVFAKSFYRIIGTVVGATVALLLVTLFSQESALFLGALALWVGICTFGSQYARNLTAYSFVLSGYTAAIIGIPGALDAGSAFYIATARVTEVCLGIIVAATINRVVLPSSLATALWHSVAEMRLALVDHVVRVLGDGDAVKSSAALVSKVLAIENERASAIFEDNEIRKRSGSFRLSNIALFRVISTAQLFAEQLAFFRDAGRPIGTGIADIISGATSALKMWRTGGIDAAELEGRLREAEARGSLAQMLFPMQSTNDGAAWRNALLSRLRELFAALAAYAKAYEACIGGASPAPGPIPFSRANDVIDSLWTGLRGALAVLLVGCFWILSAWPHGSTALILTVVATARLATMGHAVPIALAATLIFCLATIPAFVVVDMLLPLAPGFPMFALIVGPFLFCCSFLMGSPNPKTMMIGYLSGLLFASVGEFQNRMVYDPVGLLNTSIAAVVAGGVTMVLWATIAPESAEATRRRFLRIAQKAFVRLAASRRPIAIAQFEARMAEGLNQLQGHLRGDLPGDMADLKAGVRLFGTGRMLLGMPGKDGPTSNIDTGVPQGYVARLLESWGRKSFADPDKQVLRNAA